MKGFPVASRVIAFIVLPVSCWCCICSADQVETLTGDRYNGKVLEVTSDNVKLQNELLGTISIPRTRVSNISIGSTVTRIPKTNVAVSPSKPPTARPLPLTKGNSSNISNAVAPSELSSAIRQLGTNSPAVRQVQEQFLSAAGPEAKVKFNELVGGLADGSLSVSGLAQQAKAAADQLRTYRKDLGEDSGLAIDSYLAILDSFVKEAGVSAPPQATAPAGLKQKTSHDNE
jgi:hypothetical protein